MRTYTLQALIRKSEDLGTIGVLSQLVIHCVWSSDLSWGQQQSEGPSPHWLSKLLCTIRLKLIYCNFFLSGHSSYFWSAHLQVLACIFCLLIKQKRTPITVWLLHNTSQEQLCKSSEIALLYSFFKCKSSNACSPMILMGWFIYIYTIYLYVIDI